MIIKEILVGHLGKDPEVKSRDKEKTEDNFSIATNKRNNNRNGNK